MESSNPRNEEKKAAGKRILISGLILLIFFSAMFAEYWSDILPGIMHLFNSARSVGAEKVESQVFDISNNSNASQGQVMQMAGTLERQYKAISAYVKMTPTEKLPVLIVNGRSPALMDGTQLVINYDDGHMDIDLAPLFLVLMIEGMPLSMDGGLVILGGYGLQVAEASGQGELLTRQPVDNWAVLFRQKNAYMPLEEALKARVPNDEPSGYQFIRAILESGSFMKWFTSQYGLDAARALAQGEEISSLTGKTLAENETEWLKVLSANPAIQPKACTAVVPGGSLFSILCKYLDQISN
jgi:hypothetical protein